MELGDMHPGAFFVSQLVTQAFGYFALVGGLFVLVWKLGAARFAGRRVQKVRRADRAQLSFEVRHSIPTLVIGTANALVLVVLTQAGLTQLSLDGAGWQRWELALVVVALIFFNDLWFYGWHRFLHLPRVFKHVHAVHHRSIDTTPFTSYSFHVVEAVILGGWIVPVAFLVPLPVPALGAAAVIGLLNNVMAHLGYEFFPRWLLKVPGLRWVNTATFHSLHHAKSHGNYGLFTRVWDHLLGTALDGYEEAFLDRDVPSSTTELR